MSNHNNVFSKLVKYKATMRSDSTNAKAELCIYGSFQDGISGIYEPHHEKTCFLNMRKQRHRSAPLFSLHSTISLHPKSEISNL